LRHCVAENGNERTPVLISRASPVLTRDFRARYEKAKPVAHERRTGRLDLPVLNKIKI